jgi:hypothetical protein
VERNSRSKILHEKEKETRLIEIEQGKAFRNSQHDQKISKRKRETKRYDYD